MCLESQTCGTMQETFDGSGGVDSACQKLLTIPLSNDTVSHCMADMASDTQQQKVALSLQLEEALLLVFVCLHEDILFCGELPTQATAQ